MTFFRRYGLTSAVALLIFYLSIMKPSSGMNQLMLFEGEDKVVHFLMYFFLTFVVCWEFYRQKVSFTSPKMYVAAVGLTAIYGGLIEILQENFFPPRSGDWWDWFADVAGVIAGYCIARLLIPWVKRRW